MSIIRIRYQRPAQPATGPACYDDLTIPVAGATLAQAIYLSGHFAPPALCSGLGRCGRCKVRFLSTPPPALDAEKKTLSHHDIDDGWRLACRHLPVAGQHVQLPPESPYAASAETPPQAGPQPWNNGQTPPTDIALAIDVGTTSIHWHSCTQEGMGKPGYAGVAVNPQMGAGSDVVSRLAYASNAEGRGTLRRLLLDKLTRICDLSGARVTELCIAANPAMTYILLDKDCTGLARAPYRLTYRGGCGESVEGLPPVWIPPQISPFIGGDVVAGYAHLAFSPRPPEFPFLLADMGTNGECVLALSPQAALAASVPMGPALEGINLSYGTEARPGAVTGFSITPLGLEPQVMGDTAAKGITGTGYLSLLQCLRKANIITVQGAFTRPENTPPLAKKLAPAEHAAGDETRLRLPGRLAVTASDIEEILKAKAAFSLAVSRLLAQAGLAPAALKAVYLAGALGTHVSPTALEDLGFLPTGLGSRLHAVGNTALAGAGLFLTSPETRERATDWAAGVTSLELALDPDFSARYADHMAFMWQY